MIRIAVIEDDENSVRIISEYLRKFGDSCNQEIRLRVFGNGMDFIETYVPEYDIVFMDLEMPLMDGLTAARKLREKDDDVIIVFVTFLAQYAIDGYGVGALNYLLKPIKYANLETVMRKAVPLIESRDKSVLVNTVDGAVRRIGIGDIIYLEVFDNNVVYHTAHGDFTSRITLTNAEKELLGRGFSRCNRCYTVNLKYVTDVIQNDVRLGDICLAVSRHKKKQFLSDLAAYWGRNIR